MKVNKEMERSSKIVILLSVSLTILTLIHLYYPLVRYPSLSISETIPPPPLINHDDDDRLITMEENPNCDLFTGEWVRNPDAPYYQNGTCWAIHEHQNCIKYGRPDTEYINWRWKPDGCDLPIFNPYQFLVLMTDKSLAFIGDSLGRNHMQSLICLLSRVEYPIDVSTTTDGNFIRWHYVSYNFTLAIYWSPFLVKTKEEDPNGQTHTGLFHLHLDEFDEKWSTQVEDFDYLILNGGHWFWSPAMYYEKGSLVGCRYCQVPNVTDLPMEYGYRRAFKTAFKAINSLDNFKGMVILRTYSPTHFEGGTWNDGGNCIRTKPFKSSEATLEGENMELYMAQMGEFRKAEKEGKRKGKKFRLLDTTQAMLLRPDGHPSRYGHLPNENMTLFNDCVHWCLPGPIDTWGDFLLHIIKMEGTRLAQEKLHARVINEKIR